MSTKYEKLIAHEELVKRYAQRATEQIQTIKNMTTAQLEQLLDEPDEDEEEAQS